MPKNPVDHIQSTLQRVNEVLKKVDRVPESSASKELEEAIQKQADRVHAAAKARDADGERLLEALKAKMGASVKSEAVKEPEQKTKAPFQTEQTADEMLAELKRKMGLK